MIKKLTAALALSMLFATGANAASLSLVGPANVATGVAFDVEIWGDFTGEGFIAGGITFLYTSPLMTLNSITLNLDVIEDFSCPGSLNCPPDSAGQAAIVWGEFLTDLISPTDGPTLMATLSFTANIAAEGFPVAMFSMIDNPALTGGWFGAGFNAIPTPTFGSLQTVVPLPAAVWFMIGGLGTLLGFRRRS